MRPACSLVLMLAWLAGCGERDGASRAAEGLGGRWKASSVQGTSELTLEARGDGYLLRAEGDEAEVRSLGAGRYGGDMVSPEGALRFVFERRGELLLGRYTILVPQGDPVELPEVLYARVVEPDGAARGGAGGATPAALVGHWRHTEALSSGGVSLVTDTHLVLDADGSCSTWTQSEGVASSREAPTPGRWTTEGDQLLIRADAGGDWLRLGRFVHDGARLMLVRPSGDKQVYERL